MKNLMTSFKARIILLAILPMIIVCLVLTTFTVIRTDKTQTQDAETQLLSTAYAIRGILESKGNGYEVSEDGGLILNGEDLSYLNEVFDGYLSESGLYVTLILGDTRRVTSVKTDGKRAIGTQIDGQIASLVLSGQNVIRENVSVAGNNCVVAYIPLRDNGNNVGSVFVGMPMDSLEETIHSTLVALIGMAVGLGIIAILVAFFSAGKMANIVIASSRFCEELAKGNIGMPDSEVGVSRKDDLGNLVRSSNEMKGKISSVVGQVKDNADKVNVSATTLLEKADETASTTNDLSSAVEDIANGATTQAEEVTTSASAVSDIVSGMEIIEENIRCCVEYSEQMTAASVGVSERFTKLISDTEKSSVSLEQIMEKMRQVEGAVSAVVSSASKINDIASQTNLLSLNASIEAARAGDAGRGFAVVASEISALAKDSNASAEEIRAIMNSLKEETAQAVEMVVSMTEVMKNQVTTSKESQEALAGLITNINGTKENIDEVGKLTTNALTLCSSLNDSISNLSAISEENSASAEETSASVQLMNEAIQGIKQMAEDLAGISTDLVDTVEFFHSDESASL